MINRLLRFIDNNPGFSYFKIISEAGHEVYIYDIEDADSFKKELSDDFENLEPGKYKLRGSKGIRVNDKGAKFVPFTIESEEPIKTFTGSQKTNVAPQKTKIMENVYTIDQVKEMVAEAREQGKKEAEIDFVKREIAQLKSDFHEFKKKVADKFDEMDGVEDNDVLSRVTKTVSDVAPHLPAISESLKNFKLK